MREIPVYDERFTERIHRAQHDVLRKICTKYSIAPQDRMLSKGERFRMENDIREMFAEPAMDKAIKDAEHYSGITLSPGQREQLGTVCADFARSVYELPKLRFVVNVAAEKGQGRKPEPDPLPQTEDNARALDDIYANHVVQEGMARIKSFGFTDRSAFSVAGHVIKKMLSASMIKEVVEPIKDTSIEGGYAGWMEKVLGYADAQKEKLHKAVKTR